jgi:P27 family predicted phage terminase small subunit
VSSSPRAPKGLADPGRTLWRRVVGDVAEGWQLDARDLALLEAACRLADMASELEQVVESDGVTAWGSTGQVVVHPALVELRQHRAAIAALLAKVELAPPQPRTGHLNRRQRGRLIDASRAQERGPHG